MTEAKFRRPPLYYHSPDPSELKQTIGEGRFHFLTASLYQQLFLEPSLELHRLLLGNILWELHNQPSEAREAGYSELDILLSIAVIQELATLFGSIQGHEIARIQQGEKLPSTHPERKYKTFPEMVNTCQQWAAAGEVVGLVHGAFDPPHNGHSHMCTMVWPYCDHLIAGFDPNWFLKRRKGPDRPRFPQLAWRMWEIASLPTVDGVFVLPISAAPDHGFLNIYQQLGIKILGTSQDNVLLPKYQKRMHQLGGEVIAETLEKRRSSTGLISDLANDFIAQNSGISLENLQKHASRREEHALSFGYLKDYPDLTNSHS